MRDYNWQITKYGEPKEILLPQMAQMGPTAKPRANQAIPAFKTRYNILQQKSELQTLSFKFKL